MLNSLAGSKGLARVSSTPGRTQTVNFFRVGHELYLADLPGYGYAKVPEAVRQGWERLVVSYLDGRDPLALCVFFVDARHEPMEGDEMLRAWLEDRRLPVRAGRQQGGQAGQQRAGAAHGAPCGHGREAGRTSSR